MFTSPTNPKLYRVEITLNGETITDEIGFRTIETRGKQILLNGNPTFLKGICLHEEKPNGGGRANSAEDARTLLTWAKELGCNFVRLAHYPHNEYMVREAERMGILVWSEIPYEKPVIISEFGGGAKYGLHGAKNQRWTEEFQENLYRENLAMLDKIDGLAGTTPWIMKDFRSPRRVLTGIQDYHNMKGLVSDSGQRKKAWYVLKEWYEGK